MIASCDKYIQQYEAEAKTLEDKLKNELKDLDEEFFNIFELSYKPAL
jgi:predicted phage-related endonuclease